MANLFALARAGANLTPGQRTILKAVEAIGLAALVSFLSVLPQLMAGHTLATTDWGAVFGALGVAVLMAASKWFKAHGDAPLADVSALGAQQLRRVAGIPSDVIIEPPDYTPVAEDATV